MKNKRRFKIPKSIKIRRAVWKIYQEPQTSTFRKKISRGKTLMQERCYGICYYDPKKRVREIHLSKTLRGRRLESVLVHELLHAAWPSAPIMSMFLEERAVTELATPMSEVIARLITFNKRKRRKK